MKGTVASINTSSDRGEKKHPVPEVMLSAGVGIEGDAHSGSSRQVSLLASESVRRAATPDMRLEPGDFGENITTSDIELTSIRIGERLLLGNGAILQVSEIGKTCYMPCSIGQRLGECIMPREGVFAKVLRGGRLSVGDSLERAAVKVGAVLTSSDRCASGEREDESGPMLVQLLEDLGLYIADYTVVPDDEDLISDKLAFLADRCAADIVLTTGGTGFTIRDKMPEATLAVLDSQAPGISEAIRHEGLQHTPYACISRGVSGMRGRTLIVNLPGSKHAIDQTTNLLSKVIPHTLDAIRMEVTDCGTQKQPASRRE